VRDAPSPRLPYSPHHCPAPTGHSVSSRALPACVEPLLFVDDAAPTELYTLSLHDALPISSMRASISTPLPVPSAPSRPRRDRERDRKSTRLNSSHVKISYAVFCLKKKNTARSRPARTEQSGPARELPPGAKRQRAEGGARR